MSATTRLKWAVAGWVSGFVASMVVGGLVFTALNVSSAADPNGSDTFSDLSLGTLVLLQVPLWAGLLGVPLWARQKGLRWREQLGWEFKWFDVPLGLLSGLLLQLVVLPLLYWPIFRAFGDLDVEKPARELTNMAAGRFDEAVLVVMTVIMAPLAEEVFFRGLLQGALVEKLGAGFGLLVASLAFAVTHFQVVQFPALLVVGLVLGLLVLLTGRIAMALFAHVGFNSITVAVLLA